MEYRRNSKKTKIILKEFNPPAHYQFKIVDNIKIETLESFLARGGVVEQYTRAGELLNPEEVAQAKNLTLDEEIVHHTPITVIKVDPRMIEVLEAEIKDEFENDFDDEDDDEDDNENENEDENEDENEEELAG